MGQDGGQIYNAGRVVERRRLNGRDLMLGQSLADDLKSARERGIAKRSFLPSTACVILNDSDQRLLGIGQFGLRLGERPRNRAMVSLERCMAFSLYLEEVEVDGA